MGKLTLNAFNSCTARYKEGKIVKILELNGELINEIVE